MFELFSSTCPVRAVLFVVVVAIGGGNGSNVGGGGGGGGDDVCGGMRVVIVMAVVRVGLLPTLKFFVVIVRSALSKTSVFYVLGKWEVTFTSNQMLSTELYPGSWLRCLVPSSGFTSSNFLVLES